MRRRRRQNLIVTGLVLLLVLILAFSVFRIVQKLSDIPGEDTMQTTVSKTIVHEGVEYFPRQDIDVFLLMGVDKYGPVEDSGSYNNDGETDMVMLLVFDQAAETFSVLNLNRDTMLEMPVLGVGGRPAGTSYGQIALAHTYGSGLEDSCENTVAAVSGLLNGIRIDHYIAMNMDAIAVLNDAVGGVSVNVTEDFSAAGTDIPMGETVLYGQQAIDYVRYRMDVGDQMNVSRMERQNQYVAAFLTALRRKMETDSDFVVKTYEDAAPYLVTDCSSTVLSSVLEHYGHYGLGETVTLEGENRKGEVYMEFYADPDALKQLTVDLFYAPKH